MDNLTHSLIGALLGQAGLKRRTGLAMPTLIVAANIPDIDATCSVYGMQSLAMRRGLTHGPIAMIVLPLFLTGAMLAWDRWQTRRGTRPEARLPVRPGWLLALAYIGCLSHPFFDWLNSYGIRLLEPFSQRWFYGDTLFIIDLWIWIALIAGVWLSVRRERRSNPHWRRPAAAGLIAIGLYLVANGAITVHAERATARALAEARGQRPDLVVANPVPVAFWRREMLWRDGDAFGNARYALDAGLSFETAGRNRLAEVDLVKLARSDPAARAFLFWSRMPVVEREGAMYRLSDQRFANQFTSDRFSLTFPAGE